MTKQFYPPSFDFIFKLLFGDRRNINILKAFLLAALDLPEAELSRLVIVDPHLKREFQDDKMGILDVKVYTASGMVINVELLVEISQDLRKRLAFSGAKLLAGQLKRGEEYHQAERVISIVICVDGVLLHEEEGYYNSYSIRNARSGAELTDLLEIRVLELQKLPPDPDGGCLYNWGQFFKAKTAEELAMAGEKDPMIREAVATVLELNEDERTRMLADARMWWEMDHAALERQHYREGLEKGQQQAEAEYQPILEAKAQAIEAKDQENRAFKQEIEELKRKLRKAGIED
jgi:predicted transposase/invertase (TIGR01784 family)